jgi:fumarate reductase subunit D
MAEKESGLRMEPFLWTLFSAGGVLAAFLIPVHLFLWGLAFPLGWLKAPGYESAMALLAHPIVRIYLLLLCSLPLFHWAHRFRYTLYDGLQIKHLNEVINFFCYGSALLGTAVAGYLLWRIP